MIAYLYAYGKQKSLHYGTALIAKDLLSVRCELETLSAYQGHQQGERSFRHGYLANGMEYFSFAYALPNGGSTDQRGQVEVYTLVLQKNSKFSLTSTSLSDLYALQRVNFTDLVNREISEIDLDDILKQSTSAAPLPDPSEALVQAILATLLYQGAKGGTPYLLALCQPEELLSAIAALPDWLRDTVTFNTDVQSLADEPLGTINTWSKAAWQKAERSNFHGTSYYETRFLYPGENGVTFSANGVEILAKRFLRMPRKIQEQTAEQAKYDLHSLYRLLRRQEQEDENILLAKPTQRKRKQCSRHIIGPVLLSSLLFLAGLILLIIAAFWLPNSSSCFLRLQITEDTVLFSSAVLLGYALSWGSTQLLPARIWLSFFHTITGFRIPLSLPGTYIIILLLLYFAGQSQTTFSYVDGVCSLHLWLGGSPDRLLCGNLIGMILWVVKQLREVQKGEQDDS